MRVTALTFDGYASGKSGFPDDVGQAVPLERFTQLMSALDTAASLLAAPTPNRFMSFVIIGHSDRDDTANRPADVRRSNEIKQATERAVNAWENIKQVVAQKVTALGADPGPSWWESSTNITWALVYAGVGMLKHDNPGNDETKRLQNRRVVILLSEFPAP